MRQSAPQPDMAQMFVRAGEAEATNRQVTLVSGCDVPLVHLDLPPRLRGQAREQVALRQLSDKLGLKPDQIAMRPFVSGLDPKKKAPWNTVFAAEKAWLADLQKLPGRAVLPDYMSLPAALDLWVVQPAEIDGHPGLSLRFGPDDGMTALIPLAIAAMRQTIENGPAPKAILAIGNLPEQVSTLAADASVPVVTDVKELDRFQINPKTLGHGELELDLRSNPAAAKDRVEKQIRPWVWAGLAASLAAGIWAGGEWLALQRNQSQSRDLANLITSEVQETFTKGAPVLDVRLQVTRALDAMKATDEAPTKPLDPLDMGVQIAQILHAAQAKPELVRYDEKDGMRVVAILSDFASVDTLAEAIRAEGYTVTLRDSRTETSRDGIRADYAVVPQISEGGE
ncbi:hypothetical protein J7443_01520 [Tropicibacter sp. R15_0]|uniref:hypothetical protein n=1 Tax=Tropicibacter sp. R15_0 TaxID=2821101 RepID=UPI001ADC6B14|nr:hypothetical protein [Tropicibacter sp. R15_0]MBO9463897.1 hypothetical protein [Tropicibacter sp. R15_0]